MSGNSSLTAEDIETAYGGRWGVWQSDTDQWWAARTLPLTANQLNAGAVPFLRAATPEDLKQAISDARPPKISSPAGKPPARSLKKPSSASGSAA